MRGRRAISFPPHSSGTQGEQKRQQQPKNRAGESRGKERGSCQKKERG